MDSNTIYTFSIQKLDNPLVCITKDYVCEDKGICEVAVIDATERKAKTTASAEPTLSAKVIAQKTMVAAHQEFNGICFIGQIFIILDVLYQCNDILFSAGEPFKFLTLNQMERMVYVQRNNHFGDWETIIMSPLLLIANPTTGSLFLFCSILVSELKIAMELPRLKSLLDGDTPRVVI